MKLCTLLALLLTGFFLTGCQVKPIPETDARIAKLRDFAEKRRLNWSVEISHDGDFYCTYLSGMNRSADQCSHWLGLSINAAMSEWGESNHYQVLAHGVPNETH